MPTNPAPSLPIPVCFLILRKKFRNWAMLFYETLVELFDTVVIFRGYSAWQLKCFVMKKNGIFLTSTQILGSVYVPGRTI